MAISRIGQFELYLVTIKVASTLIDISLAFSILTDNNASALINGVLT